MTSKDLQGFAASNWAPFRASITDISKINGTCDSLISSEIVIYDFDKICKSLFRQEMCPTSADGLTITQNSVVLIEFKSGFKQKITKNNFDNEISVCEHTGESCEKYWSLFFKNQSRERKELLSSLRFKAIESYVTLEKHIYPSCPEMESNKSVPVKFIVVIDEDGTDSMENTLAELAKTNDISDNCFKSIRQTLKRLQKQNDSTGNTYYYDSIDVMSSQDFCSKLKYLH